MSITYPGDYTNINAGFGNVGINVAEIWFGNGIWDPPLWDWVLPIDPNMPDGGKFEYAGSILDLRSYAASAGEDTVGYNYTWASELNWGGAAGDEGWEATIEKINNGTSWIWGDVYTGLGIVKKNGLYYFLGTYGLYHNADETQEMIVATGSNSMTLAQLANGFFSWYVNVTAHSPYVGSFYGDGMGVYVQWVTKNSGPECVTTHQFQGVEGIGGVWPHLQYDTQTGRNLDESIMNTKWISVSGGEVFGGNMPLMVTTLNTIASPYAGGTPPAYYADKSGPAGWILGKGGTSSITINIGGDSSSTPAGDNGGDGDYDTTSDDIGVPSDSQFSTDALDTGLFRIYTPTKTQLQDFAQFIYSSDLLEWLEKKIDFLLTDPMDLIISLNMAHFTPSVGGGSNIVFAGKSSNVYSTYIDKQMHHIDCGEINVPEQTNSFQDYNNYSHIHIYLPYCGIHQLATNEVIGGKVKVEYWIDCITGSCVAFVTVTRNRGYKGDSNLNSVMYSFTGNCFQAVPLIARDFTQTIQSLATIAGSCATGAVSAATGNIAGVIGAVGSAATSALNMNASVNRIGNFGHNFGYMQMQKPYLILERPIASTPSTYEERYGRPLNDYKTLNDCYGYCEIDVNTIWVDKFEFITSEEEDMLKTELAKGIFINHDSAYYNYNP